MALSKPQPRALQQRKGDRHRRPKHDLDHLQDKEAKTQTAELLKLLKKRALQRIDETTLTLNPPLRVCWIRFGIIKTVCWCAGARRTRPMPKTAFMFLKTYDAFIEKQETLQCKFVDTQCSKTGTLVRTTLLAKPLHTLNLLKSAYRLYSFSHLPDQVR
ncbi:hypothetical protein [Anaerolinea sp.]|uniref:hypothetical protein n=1 Tax=Anaerolinea sp. TaxID=1872519 RepID=UPI002ACE2EA8|nr:hypothetical protein [Anaerolinea sp.]